MYITREISLGGLKKELRRELKKELRQRLGGLQCCLSGKESIHYHKVKRLVQ